MKHQWMAYVCVIIDVTHEMSKFTHSDAGGIRRLPHRLQRTLEALVNHFEGL